MSLESLLSGEPTCFSKEEQEKIQAFYQLVLEENEIQNLTRLTTPEDFYWSNCVDVYYLHKFGNLQYPSLDLGSGAGVPGLLSGLLTGKPWILTDSEGHKAEYLQRAVNTLGLNSQIQVFSGRAEAFLKKNHAETIVARAVGSVEKMYSWIRKCSTWNNLVLLKGPGWEEEWKRFQAGPFKDELSVSSENTYFVGEERKTRKIVCLKRSK